VESFLGCRSGSILRLQGAAVETGLYFTRNIATVGVAMMKQKLTRAIPAGVEIRIVAARPVPLLCGSRVGRRENDHCPVPQASTYRQGSGQCPPGLQRARNSVRHANIVRARR